MQGVSSFADEGYKFSKDGMAKGVFVVRFGQKPSVQVVGREADYGADQFFSINNHLLMYIDPHDSGTAETWAVDPEKSIMYMTQVRAGFGPMNKASMFIGVARPGC